MEMKALDDNTQPPGEMIALHLDESLNQLKPSDLDALVLRFLKRQDFRAVGRALGISEDAAQKRVSNCSLNRELENTKNHWFRGRSCRRDYSIVYDALPT